MKSTHAPLFAPASEVIEPLIAHHANGSPVDSSWKTTECFPIISKKAVLSDLIRRSILKMPSNTDQSVCQLVVSDGEELLPGWHCAELSHLAAKREFKQTIDLGPSFILASS